MQDPRWLASVGDANLRFNEDLATRPAWFPPSAAGPALALADWWQEDCAEIEGCPIVDANLIFAQILMFSDHAFRPESHKGSLQRDKSFLECL